MGFISEKARTRKGISPILATIMLCTIAIVAVAVMYPIVSSAMSAPVYAISITQTSLIKQGNYIVMTVNLKNTGSARVTVGCTLYDGSFNEYVCQGGSQSMAPGTTKSFVYESNSTGSRFNVGSEYRVDVWDSQNGRLGSVKLFCTGR